MGFNIKGVLGTVAPWLATAVGGPMAGQAVAMITGAMGLKSNAKVDDIQNALAAGQLTGDQLVALKKADQEFALAMQAAGFADTEALEALASKDREDARAREIAVKDWTPRILAYGVTAGFFGILVFMLLHAIPSTSREALLIMLGALQSAWVGVISYYFGSSSGSVRKTELLAQPPTTEGTK